MSQGFTMDIAKQIMGNGALGNEQTTPRARILNEAMTITHHDRNANYGNPEDNFKHIANLWNAYLKVSKRDIGLTPADVAVMNMFIKVARLGNNPAHHDSAVDIAGYAACLGDIQEILRAKAQNSEQSMAASVQQSQGFHRS